MSSEILPTKYKCKNCGKKYSLRRMSNGYCSPSCFRAHEEAIKPKMSISKEKVYRRDCDNSYIVSDVLGLYRFRAWKLNECMWGKQNEQCNCIYYQRKWYLSLWDKLKLWGWVRGEEMSLLEGCEVVSHVKQ